jgi:nickel-dependent lactate racemase
MRERAVQIVSLPQLAWNGADTLDVAFPESWQIELCHMAGHDRPALSPALVEQAILFPIGTPPIREAARGKKEVCIIFDDMSRPTRVAPLIPYVLAELEKAGIGDGQIRFVCALGSHGALTRPDFVKKLGEDVVSRFPVFNHNLVGNCTLVGITSLGIELCINSEVMGCDYKIAIGSVVPHAFAGFGGGAKIILPGVASFETIRAMHRMKPVDAGAKTMDFGGMGCIEGNLIRHSIEEAAAMVGLDFKIDAIVNTAGETVSVYTGAPAAAFEAALAEAKWHYLTARAENCDIVVTNTFAKANEGEGGTITGFASINKTGGDLVLISNAPEGHVTHYLFGNWGTLSPDTFRLVVQIPSNVKRLIIFSEYMDRTAAGYFAPSERVLLLHNWNDVLQILEERHSHGAKVAVYSSAEIQYCGEAAPAGPPAGTAPPPRISR